MAGIFMLFGAAWMGLTLITTYGVDNPIFWMALMPATYLLVLAFLRS